MTITEILNIIFKTFICYVFLLVILRVMGKREIGEVSTFDIVVFFVIYLSEGYIMEYKKLDNDHYVMRLNKGEEVIEQLKIFATNENVLTGEITGIGASNKVEIGWFNTETKEYKTTVKEGMFEVTSLLGNISRKDGEVYLHCHINFADASLNTLGGHLVKCYISATCEIIITVIHGEVGRRFDKEIGLNLFQF